MVEKMGHKKRMQMMRMEWINEGKGHSSVHENSLFDEPAMPARENREQTATRIAPIFEIRQSDGRLKTPVVDGAEEMDLYDATPRARRQAETQAGVVDSQDSIFGGGSTSLFGPKKVVEEDAPPEDELDALLAEEAQSAPAPAQNKAAVQEDEYGDDLDDLDALMAEEEMLQATSGNSQPVVTASKAVVPENNYEDDEEAMMEMDW
jgi:replication fork protection complex subunit Csm3/Swi3